MSIAISCGWRRSGPTVPTVNVSATALRFFFKITLKRHDLAEEVVSTREPRRLPVVLSPEEVGRLLASARNIKHKGLLSLAYATGLRASQVVSLKLTDIDSDRMVIRVEQGTSLPPRRREARRIVMSFSRPTCSRYCANGGASRARRDGCLPVSTGCFLATGGSIRVRASSTGSFAWQHGTCQHNQTCRRSHTAAQLCHPSLGAEDRYSDHPEPAPAKAGVLLGHKKLDTTALYTRVAVSALGQVTSPLDLLLKMPG